MRHVIANRSLAAIARASLTQRLLATAVGVFLAIGCAAPAEHRAPLRSMERAVPRVTFSNLSPPYLEHDYFQGSGSIPFQFDATAFSLVNAWWLAEASTLVYAGEDFVRSRFRAAGLPEVMFFRKLSTQVFVAHNDAYAIVAFRGSEIWKRRETFNFREVTADLKTDMDIWPTQWEPGGRVHRGFGAALDEVWPNLLPCIRSLERKGCKIWITGHSLGGALATLCASRYGRAQGVYTFGAPRVGDDDFKTHLNVDIYRIVNDDDIVPRLPSLGIYTHVGELKFIDGYGILRVPADGCGPADRPAPENHRHHGFVPAAFRDHVPLLYAVHLWNNMVRQR